MASIRIRRQAVTSSGVLRRVGDLDLARVCDPRVRGRIEFSMDAQLKLLVVGALSGASSMREVELRSEQLRDSVRGWMGLKDRVADNTLGLLLQRLAPSELRAAMVRQVKAEHRRGGGFGAQSLKWSTFAIDGKHVSTLQWHALVSATRRVLKEIDGHPVHDDPGWLPTKQEVRLVFSTRFPHVQLAQPKDKSAPLYGLVRVHRTTLVSHDAAPCVDENPIHGETNELGSIVKTIQQLVANYRHTNMMELVTMDAGNTCLNAADLLVARGVQYFMAIKSPQGDIHDEALRVLAHPKRTPDFSSGETRSGRAVAYETFVEPLPEGYLKWAHARALVRVHRVTTGTDVGDKPTEGNRYYVTSIPPEELTAELAQSISRHHWRCENEGHWTSDAIFKEDARQAPWSRHPTGVLAVSAIRMIAENVLAMFRALSKIRTSVGRLLKPPWNVVRKHFLAVLFDARLESAAFDA